MMLSRRRGTTRTSSTIVTSDTSAVQCNTSANTEEQLRNTTRPKWTCTEKVLIYLTLSLLSAEAILSYINFSHFQKSFWPNSGSDENTNNTNTNSNTNNEGRSNSIADYNFYNKIDIFNFP